MIPALTEPQRRVFSAIVLHPGSSVTLIGRVAEVNPGTAHASVRRLERLRLIRTAKPHGERLCRPADGVLS